MNAPVIDRKTEGAGKGDSNRVNDVDAYRRNYERAFGRKTRRAKPGTYVFRGGQLVQATEADAAALRNRDATNIRCLATGVNPEQAETMNRQFGHLGVNFDHLTGDAIYKDRNARIRVNKARGFFDRDEVRG